MKSISVAAAACVAMLFAAGPLAAQPTVRQQNANNLAVCSDLLQAKVTDQQNQDLGRIQNVVLDEPTGQIRYVVLDVNNNKVAVPWTELNAKNANQGQIPQFTVNRTRQQLENATRFNANDLSNLSQGMRTTAETNTANNGKPDLVLASQVKNAQVQTSNDQQIGHITNLVINTNDGQVRYAVVETSGKKVAVAWTAFRERNPSQNDQNMQLVINRTKSQLQNEPTFHRNDLSNLTASVRNWDAGTRTASD